jgi:hypothetical protein
VFTECKWCTLLLDENGCLLGKLHRRRAEYYICKCFEKFDAYYAPQPVENLAVDTDSSNAVCCNDTSIPSTIVTQQMNQDQIPLEQMTQQQLLAHSIAVTNWMQTFSQYLYTQAQTSSLAPQTDFSETKMYNTDQNPTEVELSELPMMELAPNTTSCPPFQSNGTVMYYQDS